MPTLDHLGVTPSHLTQAARDLVLTLRGNSCAWKVRGGWRPKGGGKTFLASTATILINKGLADIRISRGPQRLELTSAGEELAKLLKAQRTDEAGQRERKRA